MPSLGSRYQLGELIGTGGMSDVYQATDTLLGRDVAVKIMRADLARDESFRERFRREAQNGGSLNHPAIVAVYDTGDTELHGVTVPYIVMELVLGKTLRDVIREEAPLQPADAAKILVPVCEALQVSHDAGIVHRDIKPANIMITPTGDIKVMDFGIARALSDVTNTMTATATVIGTAQYLSPEQARGKRADGRSDIYATGCVFYELITGQAPFSGESPLAIAYQHVQEEPTPPSELIPGLSPTVAINVDSVCLTAMAKHPGDRYQTASEFAADLRHIEHNNVALAARTHLSTEPVPDNTVVIQRTLPPKKKPWGTVVATLAVLGLLGASAIYFVQQGLLPNPGTQSGSAASQSKNVSIPQLAGRPEVDATTQLQELGLKVERKEEPSPTVAKGQVISTNPAAGSQIREGATVTLIVSTGKEIIEVPDLKGLTTEAASQALARAGLELDPTVKQEFSSQVAKGTITEQSPGAGSQVSKGSRVTITVSRGEETVRVPSIDGMQWDNAEGNLTTLGLVPHVTYVDSAEPKGTVISLEETGQMLPKGSPVTVTVSNGAALSTPSLTGLTTAQALKALRDAGWRAPDTSLQQRKVATNVLVEQGKIAKQDPPAGSQLSKDALVYVDVYEFSLLPPLG